MPARWLFMLFLLSGWAHASGFALALGGDLLGLLGGIMGAIFTAGGLVIALVAVLTQLQLQDRVTAAVEKAKQDVVDKFNRELRPTLLDQMQQQVEGRLLFFQATLAKDWRIAQNLIRQALDRNQRSEEHTSELQSHSDLVC